MLIVAVGRSHAVHVVAVDPSSEGRQARKPNSIAPWCPEGNLESSSLLLSSGLEAKATSAVVAGRISVDGLLLR
jgi:hypothetical protein